MPVSERLVEVSRALSETNSLEQVQAVVRRAARELTGADGATFIIRDGDRCVYLDEDAIAPLWKGRRFPISECISGWCIRNQAVAVIEDVDEDERIPHDLYRRTFVKSLAIAPIRRTDPVGAIGIYWARRHKATAEELEIVQALADGAALAMAHAGVQPPRTALAARTAMAEERCRNLYVFIRLRVGHDLSDRELARRWGMNWRSFLNLKAGCRRVPRLEELETLADVLSLDPLLVLLVARGKPADVVNRWLLEGEKAVREGLLASLGTSAAGDDGVLLHSRIDQVPGALLTMDLQGRLRDWNTRLAAVLDGDRELKAGVHFIGFIAVDSVAGFLKMQAEALDRDEAGPEPVRLESGPMTHLSLTRVDDAGGRPVGFQVLLQTATGS